MRGSMNYHKKKITEIIDFQKSSIHTYETKMSVFVSYRDQLAWVYDKECHLPLGGRFDTHLNCYILPLDQVPSSCIKVNLDVIRQSDSETPVSQYRWLNHLLIIEDDICVSYCLAYYLLHKYHCNVDLAHHRQQIIEKLETKYDLIIADTTIVHDQDLLLINNRSDIPNISHYNQDTPIIYTDNQIEQQIGYDYWGARSMFYQKAHECDSSSDPNFRVKRMVIDHLIETYMFQ